MKKDIQQLFRFFYEGVCFYLVGRKLKKNGLISDISIGHWFNVSKKIIIDKYQGLSFEEYQDRIFKVRTLFPKAKRSKNNSWSPYGEVVIYEVLYKVLGCVNIAIWYETTVQNVPSVLLHDGCRFVEETKKTYSLVCEVKV